MLRNLSMVNIWCYLVLWPYYEVVMYPLYKGIYPNRQCIFNCINNNFIKVGIATLWNLCHCWTMLDTPTATSKAEDVSVNSVHIKWKKKSFMVICEKDKILYVVKLKPVDNKRNNKSKTYLTTCTSRPLRWLFLWLGIKYAYLIFSLKNI